MKPRAAFLLTLLLFALAAQPGARATGAATPKDAKTGCAATAFARPAEQRENSCCETACPCCRSEEEETTDCACEASPETPFAPVQPAVPAPAHAAREASPALIEWRSPAPPLAGPAPAPPGKGPRTEWIEATTAATGKVSRRVRHCSLLI